MNIEEISKAVMKAGPALNRLVEYILNDPNARSTLETFLKVVTLRAMMKKSQLNLDDHQKSIIKEQILNDQLMIQERQKKKKSSLKLVALGSILAILGGLSYRYKDYFAQVVDSIPIQKIIEFFYYLAGIIATLYQDSRNFSRKLYRRLKKYFSTIYITESYALQSPLTLKLLQPPPSLKLLQPPPPPLKLPPSSSSPSLSAIKHLYQSPRSSPSPSSQSSQSSPRSSQSSPRSSQSSPRSSQFKTPDSKSSPSSSSRSSPSSSRSSPSSSSSRSSSPKSKLASENIVNTLFSKMKLLTNNYLFPRA